MALVAMTMVPGYGGRTALVYLLGSAVAAGLLAWVAARRSTRRIEQAAVAAAAFAVALAALTRLPGELKSRSSEYRASRSLSQADAEAGVQRSVGVDPDFLGFLERHVRGSFYVVTGPKVTTSAPQSWAQYELLPRLEAYTACRADWIVFFESPPHATGISVGSPVLTYKPDYSLARNRTPCT